MMQLVRHILAGAHDGVPARMTSEVGDMRRYGLFSYQIAIALPTWNGAFSSLVQTLSRAYKPRPFPTPLFEGTLEEVMPLQQHTLTTPMPNRLQGVRQEAQPQRRP